MPPLDRTLPNECKILFRLIVETGSSSPDFYTLKYQYLHGHALWFAPYFQLAEQQLKLFFLVAFGQRAQILRP